MDRHGGYPGANRGRESLLPKNRQGRCKKDGGGKIQWNSEILTFFYVSWGRFGWWVQRLDLFVSHDEIVSIRTYPMSFHTLQISSSHHSAMFHSAFVFEHEHRIHECIFMHTVFVTLHIGLLPTAFSGCSARASPFSDLPRCRGRMNMGTFRWKKPWGCQSYLECWVWKHKKTLSIGKNHQIQVAEMRVSMFLS